MEEYKIRYATPEDIPAIKRFIHTNWKPNHILVREQGLFEWQYTSDKLDYVLGFDSIGNIQGMLGFISYDDTKTRDIATSMWKANLGTGFLGIKLLKFVLENEPHRTLFSLGINLGASGGIYRRMGIATGKMNQWYRLGRRPQYYIAKIKNNDIPDYLVHNEVRMIRYESLTDMQEDFDYNKYVPKSSVPYKSLVYLDRRYFNHPSYHYLIYGIKTDGEETSAVIILRVQEYQEACVLRFIDCIGNINAIGFVTKEIDELLDETNAEYIDMYEKGFDSKVLKESGWKKVDETKNIIPNYFSPYEQRNIDVNYCTANNNIVLFRGDGDQDRPN